MLKALSNGQFVVLTRKRQKKRKQKTKNKKKKLKKQLLNNLKELGRKSKLKVRWSNA